MLWLAQRRYLLVPLESLTVSQGSQRLRYMILTRLHAFAVRFTRAPWDPVVDAAGDFVVDLGAPSAASSTAAAAATTAILATTRMPASFGDVAQARHVVLCDLVCCKSSLSKVRSTPSLTIACPAYVKPSPSSACFIYLMLFLSCIIQHSTQSAGNGFPNTLVICNSSVGISLIDNANSRTPLCLAGFLQAHQPLPYLLLANHTHLPHCR